VGDQWLIKPHLAIVQVFTNVCLACKSCKGALADLMQELFTIAEVIYLL